MPDGFSLRWGAKSVGLARSQKMSGCESACHRLKHLHVTSYWFRQRTKLSVVMSLLLTVWKSHLIQAMLQVADFSHFSKCHCSGRRNCNMAVVTAVFSQPFIVPGHIFNIWKMAQNIDSNGYWTEILLSQLGLKWANIFRIGWDYRFIPSINW